MSAQRLTKSHIGSVPRSGYGSKPRVCCNPGITRQKNFSPGLCLHNASSRHHNFLWRNPHASITLCCFHSLILSTKERFPYLCDEQLQVDLHAYLGEISNRLGCPPIRVGGVEDLVHLLARFGRTITQAEWVKELKRVSNLWLTSDGGLQRFQWQSGYDFSVSASDLELVKRYIENQKEHHKRMSYQDEVRKFLNKYGMEWDERYIWD